MLALVFEGRILIILIQTAFNKNKKQTAALGKLQHGKICRGEAEERPRRSSSSKKGV